MGTSLSEAGKLAREILLDDWKLLKDHGGASPSLNIIRCYERDDACPFFPTDVYSFHVDRFLYPPIPFYVRTMASQVSWRPMHKHNKSACSRIYGLQLKKYTMEHQKDLTHFWRSIFFDLHYLC